VKKFFNLENWFYFRALPSPHHNSGTFCELGSSSHF